MSPHVGNFVQDLVEMAKATERLPGLEAELSKAQSDIESYAKQVQDREMHIIELKAEIEAKNEVIRSLEVAKDQAETMFLELGEKTHQVMGMLIDFEGKAKGARLILDPPQPEPVKVEISETMPGREIDPNWNVDQGQGEAGPTSLSNPSEPQVEATHTGQETFTSSEPSPGPYSGLRYYDHPTYVAYDRWIEGGGTEEDYHWRPSRSLA